MGLPSSKGLPSAAGRRGCPGTFSDWTQFLVDPNFDENLSEDTSVWEGTFSD